MSAKSRSSYIQRNASNSTSIVAKRLIWSRQHKDGKEDKGRAGEDYDGAPSPPNNLPAKYGRYDTSGLAVRIEKGKNEIPALQLR